MNVRRWIALGLSVWLGLFTMSSAVADASASDVASSTRQVVLYLDQKDAIVNGTTAVAAYPPTVISGRTYVPAKFLAESLSFALAYSGETKLITMTLPDTTIVVFDSKKQTVLVDGRSEQWDDVATIRQGHLMVQVGWLCKLLGAAYSFDNELKKIIIQYVRPPVPIYNYDSDNSNPTAKFALNKASFRLGEPIKYIDLSYDADGDGIVHYAWQGRQEAFFEAGSHAVTLRVTDKQGNISTAYTRQVIVEDIPYLTEAEFPFYHYETGRYVRLSDEQKQFYKYATPIRTTVVDSEKRKLLVSDSPETIREEGILYQDQVSGQTRLYAHHMNGTTEPLHLGIVATNTGIHPVKVTTTNKGEVFPTLYTHLIGYQAAVDFLLQDPYNEEMTIAPGETRVFKQMPVMLPQQGVNMIYDVKMDGYLQFSFIASKRADGFVDVLTNGKRLPYNGHVRGTFDQADVHMVIDGRDLSESSHLLIGDGATDPFVTGFDTLRGEYVLNRGNYGVSYKVEIQQPGRMALLLLPRGGSFKGGLRINGEMVLAPGLGVMTAYDGMNLLARTTGNESSVTIEFMPPAGSSLPISLVLYKLTK